MLLEIISGKQQSVWGPATQLVVVFDGGSTAAAPNFRRQLYPEYKATRSAVPDEVKQAFLDLKGAGPTWPGVVHDMGVNTIHVVGMEADDIIAAMATELTAQRQHVTIYSNDKDFQQLLAPDVCLVRNTGVQTLADFTAKFGFEPAQFVEYQALTGDAADNIPGVAKIGEKRALALVQEFKTIENIFAAVPSMKEGVVKKALVAAGLEHALRMRTLVTLQTELRHSHGGSLLDFLPYGRACLLDTSSEGVLRTTRYFEELGLKQNKALWTALLKDRLLRSDLPKYEMPVLAGATCPEPCNTGA